MHIHTYVHISVNRIERQMTHRIIGSVLGRPVKGTELGLMVPYWAKIRKQLRKYLIRRRIFVKPTIQSYSGGWFLLIEFFDSFNDT